MTSDSYFGPAVTDVDEWRDCPGAPSLPARRVLGHRHQVLDLPARPPALRRPLPPGDRRRRRRARDHRHGIDRARRADRVRRRVRRLSRRVEPGPHRARRVGRADGNGVPHERGHRDARAAWLPRRCTGRRRSTATSTAAAATRCARLRASRTWPVSGTARCRSSPGRAPPPGCGGWACRRSRTCSVCSARSSTQWSTPIESAPAATCSPASPSREREPAPTLYPSRGSRAGAEIRIATARVRRPAMFVWRIVDRFAEVRSHVRRRLLGRCRATSAAMVSSPTRSSSGAP